MFKYDNYSGIIRNRAEKENWVYEDNVGGVNSIKEIERSPEEDDIEQTQERNEGDGHATSSEKAEGTSCIGPQQEGMLEYQGTSEAIVTELCDQGEKSKGWSQRINKVSNDGRLCKSFWRY